jgi:hypothetical protein
MGVGAILEKVPTPIVLFFTALGAIITTRRVISYIQLLLDLFVLPGTSVSLPAHGQTKV